MARRRKKSRATPKPGQNGTMPVKEKALPSLPPGAVPQSAFSPEMETPPSESHSGTPGARSPPERQYSLRRHMQSDPMKRDVSPMAEDSRKGGFTCASRLKQLTVADAIAEGQTLPASTYGDGRPSNVSQESEDGEERGFLPMAFDPNPAPGPPPMARKPISRPQDPSPPVPTDRPSRDYFGKLSAKPPSRDARREEERSRSVSTERELDRRMDQPKSSPHILFQEKGRHKKRETSGNNTPASASAAVSPSAATAQERNDRPIPQHLDTNTRPLSQNDGFRLQEVPKSRRAGSRSSSKNDQKSPISPLGLSPSARIAKEEGADKLLSTSPVSTESPSSGVNPFDDPKRRDGGALGATSAPPRHADRPARGDSLTPGVRKAKGAAPEPPTPTLISSQPLTSHARKNSTSSIPSTFADALSTLSRDNSGSKTLESPAPVRSSFDAPPPRASSRPTVSASSKSVANDDFVAPRAPPPPPPVSAERHRNNESISTLQSNDTRSDGQMSPSLRSAGLPKYSTDGGLSMEEEMARIMRGDSRRGDAPPSVLRKVSNAVKHGRSFSDRGFHGKSSSNGAIEISSAMQISSPMLASPTGRETNEQLSAQLRRAQHRIAELEAEKNALEETVDSSAEIKAATNELREKRTTMVVLDTQREMVVRELEVMTEHLSKAKDSSQPLDLNTLQSEVLKDFAESLQRLKDQISAQIEDLMHRRTQLTEEIGNLIQMKDKGFQEYETLSNKNAQLQEMNNQILHNIQDMYKSNRAPNGAVGGAPHMANGLGIYHPTAKPDMLGPSEVRNLNIINTDSSMPNLLQETEAEPATVLTAPQVVNIRKGQPKKFNWRKGGEKMAKNVTKGIKGAFGSENKEREGPYSNIGMPYNQTQQAVVGSDQSSLNSRQGIDANRPGGTSFGLFAPKNGALRAGGGQLGNMKNNSSTNLGLDGSGQYLLPVLIYVCSCVDISSVLFGSELEARCEYEKRLIPTIVSRCIEEVESRGMNVEGVYRKSGGSGQVKTVQQGFEKDGAHYDISDPDLDIHAVTSALKQYFRKLPTPLITYDVYDGLLDAGKLQDKEKQVAALRVAVGELPEHHHDCLDYLVHHLARVMAHEPENLMTPLNLAVVFAPTIMRPLSIEREMSDMQAQRIAVQALLENHLAVFVDEE